MPSGVDDDEDAFSQIALTPSSIKRFRSREASANTSSSHKTTLTLTDEDPFPPGSSSSSGGGGGSSERLEDMTLAVRALDKRREASNATSEPDGASSSTDAFANMTDSDSVSDTKTQPDEGGGKNVVDEIEALTGEDSTTTMTHGVIPSLLERGEFDVDLAVISEDFANAQRSHDVEFAGRFASDNVVDALAPAHVDIPDSLRSEYLTTFGSARPPLKASGGGDGVLEQYRDVLLHAVQQHIESLQQRRPPRARKQRRRRADATAATAWTDDVADHVNDFLHTLEPNVKAFLRAPAADVEQRIVERLLAQQQQQQVSVSDVGAVEARLGTLTALVRDLDGTVSLRVRQELEAIRDADLAAIHSEIDALRGMSSELDDVRTRVRLSELQLIEKRLGTNVVVPSSSPLTSSSSSSSSSARSWKCSTTVASVSLLLAIILFAAELLLLIRSAPSGVSFVVPSSQALT